MLRHWNRHFSRSLDSHPFWPPSSSPPPPPPSSLLPTPEWEKWVGNGKGKKLPGTTKHWDDRRPRKGTKRRKDRTNRKGFNANKPIKTRKVQEGGGRGFSSRLVERTTEGGSYKIDRNEEEAIDFDYLYLAASPKRMSARTKIRVYCMGSPWSFYGEAKEGGRRKWQRWNIAGHGKMETKERKDQVLPHAGWTGSSATTARLARLQGTDSVKFKLSKCYRAYLEDIF